MASILVVDDELGIRELLFEILNDEGHSVSLAENAAAARAARRAQEFDLALLDIWMPDTDGVTLLKEWAHTGMLSMPVIMMSGHATIDTAVEATKIGAHSFLEKPITLQKLLKAINDGLDRSLRQRALRTAMPEAAAAKLMGGGSPAATGFTSATVTTKSVDTLATLTVEMAMTGGQTLPVTPSTGLLSTQSFLLDQPLRDARDAFEKAYFEFHLAKELGSMTRVAEKTGLERTHLYRKLKQLGVDLSRNKKSNL